MLFDANMFATIIPFFFSFIFLLLRLTIKHKSTDKNCQGKMEGWVLGGKKVLSESSSSIFIIPHTPLPIMVVSHIWNMSSFCATSKMIFITWRGGHRESNFLRKEK